MVLVSLDGVDIRHVIETGGRHFPIVWYIFAGGVWLAGILANQTFAGDLISRTK